MKYLLLMMISFSAAAGLDNEIKLGEALSESSVIIEQLVKQNEQLMALSDSQGKQLKGWKGYIHLITKDCIAGKGFAGMDEQGNKYRFNCEVMK
tara:strand:- start:2747 stop:3028 length:282 start_codon:yes stop_codon:yes gene_type:complete